MGAVLEFLQQSNTVRILRDVLCRWRMIIPLVLAAGIISYGILYCQYTADYSVSATLAVMTPDEAGAGGHSASGETMALLTQLLSDARLQQRIVREAGLTGFSGSASAMRIGSTNLLRLRVTCDAPELAMAEIDALMGYHAVVTEPALGPVTMEALEKPVLPVHADRSRNPLSAAVRTMGVTLAALVLLFGYFSGKCRGEAEDPAGRIDLIVLFRATGRRLKRTWWILVLLAGLSAALSCGVAWLAYSPAYRVSSIVSVTAAHDSDISQVCQKAGNVIPDLLTSDLLRDRAADKIGISLSDGSIQAESLYGSSLIHLTVQTGDPQQAERLYAALLEECPQVASYVLGDILCRELLRLDTPDSPCNEPVYWRRAAAGAGIAAAAFLTLLLLYGLRQPEASTGA